LPSPAAHGGAAWVGVNWRPTEAAAGAPEPAVMIELAALSVAPEAPPEDLPVAEQRAEPEPPPPEPVKETPPPEPEPVPEPMPVEQPEIKLPELPQVPKLDAVLLPPPPELKPVEKKPEPKPKLVEKKEKPKPKPKIVERKPVEQRAKEAVAPKPSEQRASAPTSAAQGTASQPTVSTASWRGFADRPSQPLQALPRRREPGHGPGRLRDRPQRQCPILARRRLVRGFGARRRGRGDDPSRQPGSCPTCGRRRWRSDLALGAGTLQPVRLRVSAGRLGSGTAR
jgi:hypothetical protein